MKIGMPKHLKLGQTTACGIIGARWTTVDVKRVDCMRCRRTHAFRWEKMVANRMEVK